MAKEGMVSDKPLFVLIAELAEKKGIRSIKDLPGASHLRVDDHWELWINGRPENVQVDGVALEPYHCYIKFNGWPAGICNPFGGWIAAGSVANEAALCKALEEAADAAIS